MLTCGVWAQPKKVEVLAFHGGYGVDFFQEAAKEFNAMNPEFEVDVIGSPRAWEMLKPRFAAGTPPSLTWPGWGMNLLPHIRSNQLLPWDEYLDQPAYGQPDKTWRETFNQDLLKLGQFDGKTYVLPYNIDTYGWWYDKSLFDRHGWKPPATIEEFLELGEKMKAENIAPLTFQGRYPIYFVNGIYYPWVISKGGLEPYKAAMNLEPGAWKHPAFLEVAELIMELKRKHYFQGGAIGMNHTESQMELLVGRAAMIPCGSWLEAEMGNLVPPESELTFAKVPGFANGKGDPTAVYLSPDGKGWCLPAKGNHPEVAAEFFRYLASPEKTVEFTEAKGTMTAITPSRKPNMPAQMERPYAAIQGARVTWANNIGDWYGPLETFIEAAIKDLYNELITPEEFCDRIEAEAQRFRRSLGDERIQWD